MPVNEETIKDFLEKYFKFDKNIKNRIKSSLLCTDLLNLMNIENNNEKRCIVKRYLPRVLKKLNLEKKRYKDGNYWYGLIKKYSDDILSDDDLNLLFEERQKNYSCK